MKKTNALHLVKVPFSLLVYLLKKVKKKNDDSCHELSTVLSFAFILAPTKDF